MNRVVEQMWLPTRRTAVELETLPRTDMAVEHEVLLSSDDENSSASISYSTRSKKSKRKNNSHGRLSSSRHTPPCRGGG
ncbi:hypothetical protein L917_00227 [Phytophthora nicotianae]|uniref:Uncharacterized protein n=1 Tax=Phytophthora nicotianae TaxID=4792 RepID=W2M1L1_PHYNI|nr:hypothetical protein L917_00227 [Phytophthora nicotianae]